MVTRRVFAVSTLLAVLMVGSATPALALGGTTGSDPGGGSSGGSSSSPSGGVSGPDGGTQGSDASPAHTTARSCSLYANSSSYGLSCLGGDGGQPLPLSHYLGTTKPPRCWDVLVSLGDAAQTYGVVVPPDATYNTYLHSCFLTPLTLKQPLSAQHPPLSQTLIEIDKTKSQPCPAGDVADPKPNEFYGVNMTCFLQVKPPQDYVTNFASQQEQIPPIVIVESPALNHVRTRVTTTFTDSADCPDCSDNGKRTVDKNVGGVTIWAQMEDFKILPYGPYDQGTGASNGRSALDWNDPACSRAAIACKFTYDRSSGGQPGRYYPLRAVATWSVKYDANDGAGVHTLATFQKYDDLKMPVVDVQTLVIGNGRSDSPG